MKCNHACDVSSSACHVLRIKYCILKNVYLLDLYTHNIHTFAHSTFCLLLARSFPQLALENRQGRDFKPFLVMKRQRS